MSETRRSNRGEGAAKLSNSMNGMRVVQRVSQSLCIVVLLTTCDALSADLSLVIRK
jgi:hypothetical protein